MAQLSPAASAAASAVARDLACRGISPKLLCVLAATTSSLARCLADSPGVSSARFSVLRNSADCPVLMRHCASVQCKSTSWSGSVTKSSAWFATCAALVMSPVRYRASASRLMSQS